MPPAWAGDFLGEPPQPPAPMGGAPPAGDSGGMFGSGESGSRALAPPAPRPPAILVCGPNADRYIVRYSWQQQSEAHLFQAGREVLVYDGCTINGDIRCPGQRSRLTIFGPPYSRAIAVVDGLELGHLRCHPE